MPNVFKRVTVDYAVRGGAVVQWQMERHFTDKLPHVYQLQVARTSTPTADDFEDVGTAVSNSFYAVDDEKRVYGKTMEVHYRIKLTTSRGVYYSSPASMVSGITFRDWLHVREFYRQQKKLLSKFVGVEGYLLKLRRFGSPCPICIEPTTGEGTRARCPSCFGTEIELGYYQAVPQFFVEFTTETSKEVVDTNSRGTTRDLTVKAFTAGDILINSRDLFVEKKSDRRWNVVTVATESEFRNYPIRLSLELRQLDFKNIAYTVPLEGM